MKTYAIIPSGGTGSRTGMNIPKQYVVVKGKELIAYTIEKFQKCENIDEIIIAAQPEYFELLNDIKVKYNFTKLTKIVEGGKERQDSVFNAFSSINFSSEQDLVAVHDAARPLIPVDVINKAVETAKIEKSAVVAIKARDTLFKGEQTVEGFIDRKSVYYVQTPQIFNKEIFQNAAEKAKKENFYGTDESMLVKSAGYEVNIVEGNSLNFKVTTKEDLFIFEKLLP
ncbi:MAG: 2-C-methyl-D-erythritol 4-phosphate cytidylyltransferase [Rhodothermaceae bacterium]